jgi:hypothetical protein
LGYFGLFWSILGYFRLFSLNLFSYLLTNWPNKLKCLSLASLSKLDMKACSQQFIFFITYEWAK